MEINSRAPSLKIDCRERVGKLTLTAENVAEQYILAAIARQLQSDTDRLSVPLMWEQEGIPDELLRPHG